MLKEASDIFSTRYSILKMSKIGQKQVSGREGKIGQSTGNHVFSTYF